MVPRASLGTSQPSHTGLCEKELVKLHLFQLSSLFCYTQISSQMMNYQCFFFFAFLEVKLMKNVIVYSALGWIFTLAVWMASGTGFPFSGEAWLLYWEGRGCRWFNNTDGLMMLFCWCLFFFLFVIGIFYWTASGFSGIFKFKFWNFCSKL